MRVFRTSLVIIFCVLFVTLVSAQTSNSNFNANKGFEWLVGHCPNGNCQDDLVATAFATIALRDSGALDHADLGLQYIKSKEDTGAHCFPAGGCKIKETAFALWVLDEFGEDTSNIEAYLKDAISADPDLRNYWYLEVITTNNGTCKISYDKAGTNVQRDVPVNQGKFSCPQSTVPTLFDLNACLEANLLTQNPGLEIDVNCNDLGPSTTLGLIFTSGSNYYLMGKSDAPREIFTITNGCFGSTHKSSCNFDTSLFSDWILHMMGSDLTVDLHVQNKYDKFKAIDNAILALSTDETIKLQYINDLKALQRNDGSFNKQVFETAMAVLALKKSTESNALAQATSWLESKQSSDGSWEDNVLKTAATLYAAFSGAAINLPPPHLIPLPGGNEPVFECGDGICDPETENANNCPDDCEQQTTDCQVNGICETAFEDSSTCPQDCSCGDGACDNRELVSSSCPQDCEETPVCGNGRVEGSEQCDIDSITGFGDDTQCAGACQSDCMCEEKGGFPWWISIVIVIMLIGLMLYYFKFRKPGNKTQSVRKPSEFPFMSSQPSPRSPPPMPRTSPPAKKSRVEEELDKSLEEAKKLLKKL